MLLGLHLSPQPPCHRPQPLGFAEKNAFIQTHYTFIPKCSIQYLKSHAQSTTICLGLTVCFHGVCTMLTGFAHLVKDPAAVSLGTCPGFYLPLSRHPDKSLASWCTPRNVSDPICDGK